MASKTPAVIGASTLGQALYSTRPVILLGFGSWRLRVRLRLRVGENRSRLIQRQWGLGRGNQPAAWCQEARVASLIAEEIGRKHWNLRWTRLPVPAATAERKFPAHPPSMPARSARRESVRPVRRNAPLRR